MATWFDLMQQRWLDEAPNTFANIFEERKFRTDGSFATMLCCQIDGLDGSEPIWTAAALGDTVLFHVRGAELLQQLPKIAAGEFGVNPDGVFTSPAAVGRMREKLVISQGAIAADDVLFVATDACAEWILNLRGTEEAQLWKTLRGVTDPETFSRMVADYRASGALKNDDVTLLRVEFFAEPPRLLAFPRL
jgi:hypothetical protein